MEKLPKFIIYYICSYLNNNNVLGLSITCTFLREKISKYIFDNFYLDLTLIKISSVNIRRNIPQEFSNQFKKIRANFLEDVNPAITHLDLNIDRKINFSGRNNLTHLNMMSCFPQVIFICLDYLTNLSFDNRFNKPVFLKLPRLSVLTFGKSFNQQIDLNYLPNLTDLIFGDDFNQRINISGTKLQNLEFGESFNQSVDFANLTLSRLVFGDYYSQEIKFNTENLKYLKIGNRFQSSICAKKLVYFSGCVDPPFKLSTGPDLKYLKINGMDFEKINHANLLELTLDFIRFNSDLFVNQQFLTRLELGNEFNEELILYTPNLIELKFGRCFNKSFDLKNLINLKYLSFGNRFNKKIDISNTKIENLCFGADFDKSLELIPSLIFLRLGEEFSHCLDLTVAPKLEYLDCGEAFNWPIDLSHNIYLKHLAFGNKFNQELDLSNNIRLEELIFGRDFNQELDLNLEVLGFLRFGKMFDKKISLKNLPNLYEVQFPKKYPYYFNEDELNQFLRNEKRYF